VAGTIGGANYGVAKQVRLLGLRVFYCKGESTTSIQIAAVDWVTAHHVKPAVANMSLAAWSSTLTALDYAVSNMVAAGVTVVVAAGNEGQDACNYTPAHASGTITVGATDRTDTRASQAASQTTRFWASNYGPCLDIFAPGKDIWSAGLVYGTYIQMSGTSMASPHVAGAAALYLQAYPWASPSSVRSALVSTATSGKVWYAGPASPNKLLYSWIVY
jgi:subtilisin family serine protease